MHLVEVTIHADDVHQRIHSIGASDAFGAEYVGQWEGDEKYTVAELLFSSSFDDTGRPLGIGLSCWKTLLGAGSVRTNEGEFWLRTDTYLRDDWEIFGIADDRSYDFTRCPGQRWFIHAAHRHEVPYFVAAAYAPPAPLVGGRTRSEGTCTLWGHDGMRGIEYSQYLTKICQHFHRLGSGFCAISPAHAPHSDGGSTEGCRYTNIELATVAQELSRSLTDVGLDTLVVVPEAATIDFLVSSIPGREEYSDFITAYFGDGDEPPPANLRLVSGCSYLSCWPDRLVMPRSKLGAIMEKYRTFGVEYWVSEYSIRLPENDPRIPSAVRDLAKEGGALFARDSLEGVLWMARVIYMDLVVAKATSWQWSLAITTEDSQDGLIQVSLEREGWYNQTKLLWGLGHWSLFVRPGMSMVTVSRSDRKVPQDLINAGVMIAAFVDDNKLTILCINNGKADQDVRFTVAGTREVLHEASWCSMYITNHSANLTPCHSFRLAQPCRIPAMSLVTCTGDIMYSGVPLNLYPRVKSSLFLQVPPGQGGIVNLGPVSRSTLQQWIPYPVGDGKYVRLHCAQSGLVMAALKGTKTGYTPVHVEAAVDDGPHAVLQHWEVYRLDHGPIYLISRQSRGLLEAYGDTVRVNVRSGHPEQQWYFELVREKVPHQALAPFPSPTRFRPAPTPPHVPPTVTPYAYPEAASEPAPAPPIPRGHDTRGPLLTPPLVEQHSYRQAVWYDTDHDRPKPVVPMPEITKQARHRSMRAAEPRIAQAPICSLALRPPSPKAKAPRYSDWRAAGRPSAWGYEAVRPSDESSTAGIGPFGDSHDYHTRPRLDTRPQPSSTVSPSPSVKALPMTARTPQGEDASLSGMFGYSPPPTISRTGQLDTPADKPSATPPGTPPETVLDDDTAYLSTVSRKPPLATVPLLSRAEEIERRKRLNEEHRRMYESEMRAQQEREKLQAEQQKLSEQMLHEEATKKRGTSHLVLTFHIPKDAFTTKMQQSLRASFANHLKIKPENVVLTLIAGDTKSVKVEVRLQGVLNAGGLLDQLSEAVSASETKHAKPGEEGGVEDESSSDEGAAARDRREAARKKTKGLKEPKRKRRA